jgi:hypothetical protein
MNGLEGSGREWKRMPDQGGSRARVSGCVAFLKPLIYER